jgi:hypothetical protein
LSIRKPAFRPIIWQSLPNVELIRSAATGRPPRLTKDIPLANQQISAAGNMPGERSTLMFGRMMVTPIAQVGAGVDLQTAISSLLRAAEQAEIVRTRRSFRLGLAQVTLQATFDWFGVDASKATQAISPPLRKATLEGVRVCTAPQKTKAEQPHREEPSARSKWRWRTPPRMARCRRARLL